jgi:hypothetical protein
MLIKCICTNCAGHLEFEEENAGETVECPHCHFDTVLYLPEGTEAALLITPKRRLSRLQRRLIRIGGPVLLFLGASCAFYHWILSPFVDWLPYGDAPKLPLAFLAVVCLLAILVWLVVPVLFFLQLRKMTRVLARIESKLRPVMRVEPAEEEEPVMPEESPAPSAPESGKSTEAETQAT